MITQLYWMREPVQVAGKGKMSVEQLVQILVLGCMEREKTSLRLWQEVAAD